MFNIETKDLLLLEGDICEKIVYVGRIDYVIHAASQTNSRKFINESIQTIDTTVLGIKNVLEFVKSKHIIKFIFLSTMEVYGFPNKEEEIYESYGNNLISNEIRNCYPISKFLAENMLICYANTYKFEANILRLTQTFGPGVKYNDTRIFAEFARCAIEKKDIVLHTKGMTKRNYLYTSDAINAILLVILKGINYEIYNVSNEETYCSILEMANLISNKYNINVKFEIEENKNKYGYAPTLFMKLNSNKIKRLGWKAKVGLSEMYNNMIEYLKVNK